MNKDLIESLIPHPKKEEFWPNFFKMLKKINKNPKLLFYQCLEKEDSNYI